CAGGGRAPSRGGDHRPQDISRGEPPLFLRERAAGRRRTPAAMPTPLSGEALARHVEAEPALVSGDVVGRLAVQNALLPVVAMVAGPAEAAYCAQAARALEASGAPLPAIVPRPSATWVEPRAEEALAAFHVSLADVLAGRV